MFFSTYGTYTSVIHYWVGLLQRLIAKQNGDELITLKCQQNNVDEKVSCKRNFGDVGVKLPARSEANQSSWATHYAKIHLMRSIGNQKNRHVIKCVLRFESHQNSDVYIKISGFRSFSCARFKYILLLSKKILYTKGYRSAVIHLTESKYIHTC